MHVSACSDTEEHAVKRWNIRVLIACEVSGNVRDAFWRHGIDAVSCDILPSDNSLGHHIQGDVIQILDHEWDMMIAFPPCRYLCSSGLHWNKRRPERAAKTEEALVFVEKLFKAPIKKKVIENSVGCISTRIRKPDQIIHPNQFGHPESKTTCLWIEGGLPLLKPTNILQKPDCGYWDNQTPSGQNNLGPSKDRAKRRGTTYPGIADAMADQWGRLLLTL